ncbi:795_t:CDS:2 [Acaulospora morrowiae]|uniref:795_t:CDS:1 n=1 Tax=Acaulospora morrowiae TaxID=94023 RepID=A0A9N8ZE78_9GLOM|nr:795_t:CDS:2 [Acaulospora morrowiae]
MSSNPSYAIEVDFGFFPSSKILRFRIFQTFGIPIFTVYKIFKSVWFIILIIWIIVFSFAHIFHILLRDSENTNYKDFGSSLYSVYFILIGQYDSVTNEKTQNRLIISLLIIFSFSTTIVLLNVLIAAMTDVVNETKTTGRHVWLKQRAEIIAEIEMFTMSQSQRERKDYFPSLIYYHANPDSVKVDEKKTTEK